MPAAAHDAHSVVGIEDLDYGALIEELSREEHLPCSLHTRNSLLAAFCSAEPHPSLKGKAKSSSDIDPWQIYRDYRPGVQLSALGHVPSRVRRGHNDHAANGVDPRDLWAIVILEPCYMPGWVSPDDNDNDDSNPIVTGRWSGLRLKLWLSSERRIDLTQSASKSEDEIVAQVRDATTSEQELLRSILEHHLPRATAAYVEAQKRNGRGCNPYFRPMREESSGHVFLDIYAVNHVWVKAMKNLAAEKDMASHLQMRRVNPCLSNVLPADQAIRLADKVQPAKRWHIGEIGSDPAEMRMVRDSNSIVFPLRYVQNQRHVSVMVSDGLPQPDDAAYPSGIARGSRVGWAYAHDNNSIASLHVAEPYRRIKHVEEQHDGENSIGTICVAVIARKLVEAQQESMRLSGALKQESLPCPLFADTELTKGPARAFFAKLGFQAYSVSTWGAISIRLSDA